MYEVELKAWVDDATELQRRLDATCSYRRDFDKRDRYFSAPACAADREWSPQRFRLRRDGEELVCTYKQKAVDQSVEMNLEREFEVSDEDAFLGLVRRLGCTPLVDKHKQGRQYDYNGLTVELSVVHGLGTFLEIERLLGDDSSEADRAAAGEEVRAALETFGVSAERVEERPYTQMLLDGVGGR
ncbi:MAG: class IV adenylate cyclase [Spirochaetes bacterium]|jgi:predicted adenylyl cyclase CyaB|nr:class IV adenylate cyclase [Spirochaetota bacterium]